MKHYYFYETVNLLSCLFAVVSGCTRLKLLNKSAKIFLILLIIAAATEWLAFIVAKKQQNNTEVYNLSDLIQVPLITFYFNYCIDLFRQKKIGYMLSAVSVIFGVLNLMFFQSIHDYDSNYFIYQTLLIVVMSVLFFRQLLLNDYTKLQYNPDFWLVLILILFFTFNFFLMSLYDYYHVKHTYVNAVDTAISVLNSLSSIGFGMIFIFYPKMIAKRAK